MTPPELTTPQRLYLRSVARRLKAEASIGKAGVTEGLIGHLDRFMAGQELLKVRLADSAGREVVAEELAAALGAAVVDVVGRRVVLYRPNPDLPPRTRCHLPAL